jgi:hypothetical protein
MESPTELRNKAERYRQLALTISDRRTIEALQELAASYEAAADRLEADQKEMPTR